MQITEPESDAEFSEAFPAIQDLHQDLDEPRHREIVPGMFAVREENGLVAGFQRLTDLYHGRHFYVYDLSVSSAARSKGHGEKLLRHVEEAAREEGCDHVALVLRQGTRRRAPLLRRPHGLREARLLHAQGAVVSPKTAGRGCPISARNGAVRVAQSGP